MGGKKTEKKTEGAGEHASAPADQTHLDIKQLLALALRLRREACLPLVALKEGFERFVTPGQVP